MTRRTSKYPGVKVFENNRISEVRLTVDKLFRNQRMKELIKPDIQCALDDDKVEEMRVEYRDKPELFRSKNKFIMVDLNDRWYLVDGQHRYEMLKREFEANNNLKEEIHALWYKFKEEEEVNELFCSINKDSIKNQNYIDVKNFVMVKINEFMNLLKEYHKETFSKTKSKKNDRKTLEELRDELITHGFFENPNLTQLSSNELYGYFLTKNDQFYQGCNYESALLYKPISDFYDKERAAIQDNIVFTSKQNNFVEWLCQEEGANLSCVHYYRKEKKKIPAAIRTSVWRTYYGDAETGICPISFCNKEITRTGKPGMHCGHIISEKNGGATATHNLRPICSKCNCQMGDCNWEVFDKISFDTRSVI